MGTSIWVVAIGMYSIRKSLNWDNVKYCNHISCYVCLLSSFLSFSCVLPTFCDLLGFWTMSLCLQWVYVLQANWYISIKYASSQHLECMSLKFLNTKLVFAIWILHTVILRHWRICDLLCNSRYDTKEVLELAGQNSHPFWPWYPPQGAGQCHCGDGCLTVPPGPVTPSTWCQISGGWRRLWWDGVMWKQEVADEGRNPWLLFYITH